MQSYSTERLERAASDVEFEESRYECNTLYQPYSYGEDAAGMSPDSPR